MKLEYLYIGDFKNLRNFSLDFEENKSLVTILLGRNGCGKSNLLEGLVVIFRDLYLGRPSPFRYDLRYSLDDGKVKIAIKNRPQQTGKRKFEFVVQENAGKEFSISLSKLKKSEVHQYLPQHVFAYYSGPSDRLEEHFREHQRRFYQDLLEGHSKPFRPLFYARPVHSQFVLLSFFTSEDEKPRKFLDEHLGIIDLESVLFVLQEPAWSKSTNQSLGDNRFWGARGVVSQFLSRLYDTSLAPLRLKGKTDATGIKKAKDQEFLYLYIPNQKSLLELAPPGIPSAEFFKELESTYISDLIKEVRIRVKVRGMDGSLTFRELSEGEQQLLTVVGLLRFTKERESLLLLDEPDTHLNPAWGMKYLEILRDVAEPESDSQVLMATHDPLVITGLEGNSVIIMERNESNGHIDAFYAHSGPQGLGVVGILKSPMFGLRTTLDKQTQDKLDRRFNLAAKESKTKTEIEELQLLSDELASAGFANEFRDTNFDLFAKAFTKVHHSGRVTLTKKEIEELTKEAEEVVKELKNQQRS